MKEGRFSNAAKLDIHQVKDIQKKYGSSNVTMKELANEFNVTETHICRLVKDVKTDNKQRGTGSISFCSLAQFALDCGKVIALRCCYKLGGLVTENVHLKH